MTEKHTEESVLAMLARYLDAGSHKGFDGKEHPELIPQVKTMMSALYPVKLEHIVALMNSGRM